MAQDHFDQETKDFAGLTDALIPADTYLNSWNQTNLPTPSDIQPNSFGFNIFTPGYRNIISSSHTRGTPVQLSEKFMPNHSALNANSLQNFDTVMHDQDSSVGNALHCRSHTDFLLDRSRRNIYGTRNPDSRLCVTPRSLRQQDPGYI